MVLKYKLMLGFYRLKAAIQYVVMLTAFVLLPFTQRTATAADDVSRRNRQSARETCCVIKVRDNSMFTTLIPSFFKADAFKLHKGQRKLKNELHSLI